MKISLTGKSNTMLFSSGDAFDLAVEIEKNESIMVWYGEKFLMVTALENGFYVEERNSKKKGTNG